MCLGKRAVTRITLRNLFPPVRDAATGHPIGADGKIDWAEVIRQVNERDNGNA